MLSLELTKKKLKSKFYLSLILKVFSFCIVWKRKTFIFIKLSDLKFDLFRRSRMGSEAASYSAFQVFIRLHQSINQSINKQHEKVLKFEIG